MGAQRRQPQEQPQSSATSAQAEIAALLIAGGGAGGVGATVTALAPLLLFFVPRPLLASPDAAAEVAEQTARLIQGAEPIDVPRSQFLRRAALEAAAYRVAYLKAAVGRLSRSVLDAESGSRVETLRKAVEAEKRHLAAHVEMTRKRLAGARATDAMIELHGPILGWHHGATRRPEEPRPTHERADGMNVDLRRGIPASVVAAPGVLAGCSCAWRPPRPGARMLI